MRSLSEADDCSFGPGGAGGHGGGRGEGGSQHHGGEGGGGSCRLIAGQRQQALMDEGLAVWGQLTQRWEAPLQAEREDM